MSALLNNLPLVVFTTLLPLSAGSFIALMAAFFSTRFANRTLRRIDNFTTVPVLFAVVGFVVGLLNLVNPVVELNVLAGSAASALSDRMFVAFPFVLLAVVYLVVALAGKLSPFTRKAFALATAAVGLGFTAFMGLGYGGLAGPMWESAWSVAQMVGYAFIGGTAVALFVLAAARALPQAVAGTFKGLAVGLVVAGGVLSLVGLDMMTAEAVMAAPDFAREAAPYTTAANVGIVLAFVAAFMAARGRRPLLFGTGAMALALAAVCAARVAFYVMQPLAG